MAKTAPDILIDALLDFIAACDRMVVCSAAPSSYSDAINTVDLATITMTPVTDYTKADDAVSPYGRKVTTAAKNGTTIDHNGTATHIALCKTSDTSLRAITTCTSQSLTAGGTVDVPAWKWQVGDPT